jgi:hypothetical protein
MAYETTTVPVERSQGEIRKLLIKAQIGQLAFGEDRDETGQRWAAVTFRHTVYAVRIRVPLKVVDERAVGAKYVRARSKSRDEVRDLLYEQQERRIWRVMAWNLKARMVAVEEEIETFEQAFLPHLLNPDTGRTIYEQLAEDGRVELPAPLLALPAPEDAEVIR